LTEFVDVNDWQVFLLLGLEGGLIGANERKHFTGNVVQGKVHAFGHNVQHLINGKVVKAESIKWKKHEKVKLQIIKEFDL
jgi:hypothetical protein